IQIGVGVLLFFVGIIVNICVTLYPANSTAHSIAPYYNLFKDTLQLLEKFALHRIISAYQAWRARDNRVTPIDNPSSSTDNSMYVSMTFLLLPWWFAAALKMGYHCSLHSIKITISNNWNGAYGRSAYNANHTVLFIILLKGIRKLVGFPIICLVQSKCIKNKFTNKPRTGLKKSGNARLTSSDFQIYAHNTPILYKKIDT
ncbi:hypothetical protein PROFUN_16679, partial [Planoprotostelium fungivorum]